MNCLRLSTSQMFQYSCMITVTIAATTMYRSLVNVSSSERYSKAFPLIASTRLILDDVSSRSHSTPLASGHPLSDLQFLPGPIPLNRIEVSVRTEHDQFRSSYVGTDQGRYKSHRANLSGDAESSLEK